MGTLVGAQISNSPDILVLVWLIAKILVVYKTLPTILMFFHNCCQVFGNHGIRKSLTNILASQWLPEFW
jgi:hypothetical protein